MTFHLFALSKYPSHRIVRIPLSGQLQSEITALFSAQEQIFESRVESEIVFDRKYKPDYNECLRIDDFDDIDGIQNAITNPLAVADIDPDPMVFSNIQAIFSGYASSDKGVVALIQNFDGRRVISTGGKLTLFFQVTFIRKLMMSA